MEQISEVSYHPYIAFIAQFDHTESIRLFPSEEVDEPLLRIADRFSKDCARVREELSAALDDIGPSRNGDAVAQFAPYLFRPICLAALGRTDDVAIVLLDNLPLAIRLTAVNRSMEESEVAFCPQIATIPLRKEFQDEIESKRLAERSDNLYWPFYELHDLIDYAEPDGAEIPVDWSSQDSMPPNLRATPLCVVTRFKLNTLAALGHGTLLQQATLATMADVIRRTCLAYLNNTGDAVHDYANPIFSASDIQSLKCAFLELQGADDIALLSFCSNYSIAETLITALRSLTIGDLLEVSGHHVASTLNDRRLGSLHLLLSELVGTSKGATAIDSIRGNHVFMTTYSTLCLSHHALRKPIDAGVHGVAEAYINIDTKPGHERDIHDRLEAVHADVFGIAASALPVIPDLGKVSYRILPGVHDEIINLSGDRNERFRAGALVHSADVFRYLCRFFPIVSSELHGPETGFLDVSTSFVIPIPRIDRKQEGYDQHADCNAIAAKLPKGESLPPVDQETHRLGVHIFQKLRQAVEGHLALGDALDLRQKLREIGCPSSLQYSLTYLFEEFLACIEDPARCDAVLDLYESFAALSSLICNELPEYLASIPDVLQRRRVRAYLFESSLFRQFIDALQESFALRLQRVVQHRETRDTAFICRGGLSKFLAAMDVPVKCSVGLFRRMCDDNPNVYNTSRFKQRFAAVTSVRIGKQTTSQFHWIRNQIDANSPDQSLTKPVYLATFDIDVIRLFGPEQIVRFVHEFAHFYFDAFVTRTADDFRKWMSAEDYRYSLDHAGHIEYVRMATSEIFAELVTHFFVFKNDCDLFSKFSGLAFSEVQEAVVTEMRMGDDVKLSERLANGLIEEMYRMFAVVDLIQQLGTAKHGPVEAWPQRHPVYNGTFNQALVDAMWGRFRRYIEQYGPFYRDFTRFWQNDEAGDIWQRCEERFRSFSTEMQFKRLCLLWENAVKVYQRFRSTLQSPANINELGTLPQDAGEFGRAIEGCLRDGRPFRRLQAGAVDPLLVACELAFHYIRRIYGSLSVGKIVYVERPEETDQVVAVLDYNPYLFHPDHFVLYCIDPVARGERLLSQIACFKTLSDISSQLRARRLIDMLNLIPPKPLQDV